MIKFLSDTIAMVIFRQKILDLRLLRKFTVTWLRFQKTNRRQPIFACNK